MSSSSDITTVLFDMDGVLLNSEPTYDQLFKYWLRDHDITIDDQFYQDVLGGTWRYVFEKSNEVFGTTVEPLEEANTMSQTIVDHIMSQGLPLMENAREVVESLRMKYQLAVVSSSHRNVVEAALRHHRMEEFFSHITAFEDVQHPKPHPQPYAITMLALGVTPEQCVIVEDSLNGAKAASAAEAFVYITPDPRVPEEKYAPYGKVMHHLEDIAEELGVGI